MSFLYELGRLAQRLCNSIGSWFGATIDAPARPLSVVQGTVPDSIPSSPVSNNTAPTQVVLPATPVPSAHGATLTVAVTFIIARLIG